MEEKTLDTAIVDIPRNYYPKAFLVLYLGKLPDFFSYWAKSCEPNHESSHWFVYSDQVKEKQQVNPAVTLVPYTFSRLCEDMKSCLDITIHPENTRIVCDCRLLLSVIRKEEEHLDQYDFIGYSDLDVVYGKIDAFLPDNAASFAMISAHDNRPCGPFTLFNARHIEKICRHPDIKTFLESAQEALVDAARPLTDESGRFMPMSGNTAKDKIAKAASFCHLDESDLVMNLARQHGPVFCQATPLQPTMTRKINHRKAVAIWDNGRLFVSDIKGSRMEGAVFHFSRFKNRTRFKVTDKALPSSRIGVYKYGFINAVSFWSRLKMYLTLLY